MSKTSMADSNTTGSVARSVSLPMPMSAVSESGVGDCSSDLLSLKRKIIEDSGVNDDDHLFEEDSDCDVSSGAYFLHPKSFYLMEPDIHSQFHVYKHNLLQTSARDPISTEASRVNSLLSSNCPHNKLYCRLLASDNEAAEYLESGVQVNSDSNGSKSSTAMGRKSLCICYDLAWCLMTSACLSKGP